jgi:hypothetical protein
MENSECTISELMVPLRQYVSREKFNTIMDHADRISILNETQTHLNRIDVIKSMIKSAIAVSITFGLN